MTEAMRHRLRTAIVTIGREHTADAGVNPSVDFSTTYRYTPGIAQDRAYVREGGPSAEPLEQVLGQLEHPGSSTVSARVFSSGLSAVAAVLHLLPAGSQLVMDRHGYMGSASLAEDMAQRGLITIHRVDIADTGAVARALHQAQQNLSAAPAQTAVQPGRILLWIESPTNPLLDVADVPALIDLAHQHQALSCVDNTFATPLAQQPLLWGADLVVHSVTKFLSGHSDVLMGAVITADPVLNDAIHSYRTLYGSVAGPMDCFLALRGIRTLSVRLSAATATAQLLAQRLTDLTSTEPDLLRAVRYAGLAENEHYQRAQRLLSDFGAILTIDVGSAERADAVISQFQLWTPATSLGGVESLAERRRRHSSEPPTIPEGLIRLSVGIEDPEDLYADLLQALTIAARA